MVLLVGRAKAIKLYTPTVNMKTDKIHYLILHVDEQILLGGGTRTLYR